MPLESLYNPDKNCIFRETFNSETTVRRNGGVPTGTVTFPGEYAQFINFDQIKYTDMVFPRSFSYRVKFSWYSSVSHCLLLDMDVYEASTNLQFDLDSGYFYICVSNGSPGFSFSPTVGKIYEMIVTVDSTTNRVKCYIDTVLKLDASANSFPGNHKNRARIGSVIQNRSNYRVYLAEIYNKALTAEEVKNLYNKNSYKDIRNGLILDIDARGGSIVDRCGNSLTINNMYPKRMNNSIVCYFDGTSSTTSGILPNLSLTSPITINLWAKLIYTPNFVAICGYYTIPTYRRLVIDVNTIIPNTLIAQMGGANLTSTTFKPYMWNMFTITLDALGNVYIFVNDVLASSVGTGNSLHPSGQIAFGSCWGNTQYIQRHYQNQQRIYNRVLSAEEIAQLYTSQKHNYE